MLCCSAYDNYYLLVTENQPVVQLPVLNYTHCDGPEPISEYRFPVQPFGEPDRILQTTSFRNDQWQVDSVAVLKTIDVSDLSKLR